MTATGGTGLLISAPSLTPNHPTLCLACKAAVVIDHDRAEVAHEVTCPAGLSAPWGSAEETGAHHLPGFGVHEGRAL